MDEAEFFIDSKKISLFGIEKKASPLVVLNSYGEESGARVYAECISSGCPPFTLASISGLDWAGDLSPWKNPPVQKNGGEFSGNADSYLELLTGRMLPLVLDSLLDRPECICLAGYSLAGLFALYAAFRTDAFSRIASASGSLWFPGFAVYAENTPFYGKPDSVYLSVGDAESRTRNEILSTVRENTERLCSSFRDRGVSVTLEINRGNHFTDPEIRMAKGIRRILENPNR